MRIVTRDREGVTVLDLQGKLMGGPDADAFKAVLHKLLEAGRKEGRRQSPRHRLDQQHRHGHPHLGYTTMRRSGGDLRLLHVSDKIQSILYVTKLN